MTFPCLTPHIQNRGMWPCFPPCQCCFVVFQAALLTLMREAEGLLSHTTVPVLCCGRLGSSVCSHRLWTPCSHLTSPGRQCTLIYYLPQALQPKIQTLIHNVDCCFGRNQSPSAVAEVACSSDHSPLKQARSSCSVHVLLLYAFFQLCL